MVVCALFVMYVYHCISICINYLMTSSDKLKFLIYADDKTIYFNLEDFDSQNIESDINAELEKVCSR